MSSNETRMADIREDNNLVTPEQTLEDALAAIRDGTLKPRSLLILILNGEDPTTYDLKWFACK